VPGDVITIDGRTGEVFEGVIPGTTEVVREARTLLSWAAELGIDVGAGVHSTEVPPTGSLSARAVTPDMCLRVIGIKGFALLSGIADAVLADPAVVEPILDQLAIDGLVSNTAGARKLTDAGARRAAALLEADRDAWGPAEAESSLDAFLELDHRVKETVTAWQLRDAEAGVLNDHSDAAYDVAVLERLAALHADAAAWCTSVEAGLPRLGDYRARLSAALERAEAGDGRYVASPRVDSYHGVWFELHEDLIGLAGRTRADEAAAGRA
jgi:pyruvate,orthophosphate dikinase